MKHFFLFFSIFFLLGLSCADYTHPLNQKWSVAVAAGDIYLIDADSDGLLEVYAASYTRNSRACIYSYNYDGRLLRDECVPEFSRLRYPGAAEKTSFIYLGDINGDKSIDVVSSVQVVGGNVNIKKLLVSQREFEYGLGRYSYSLKWEFAAENHITDVSVSDVDLDGWSELIASSLDGKVYVLNQGGSAITSYDAGSGVWAVFPVSLGNGTDILAGSASSVFLLSGFNESGTYSLAWEHVCGERIVGVSAGELDSDSYPDFVAFSEDNLYFFSDQRLSWKKPLSEIKACLLKDADNDGAMDLLVLTSGALYSFDCKGNVQWTHPSDESLSSLAVDVYNNIFLGSFDHLFYLTVNQDYVLNKKAEEGYDSAYSMYLSGRLAEARSYATQAKQFFELAGNREGSARCDFILLVTKDGTASVDARVEAGRYFSEASSLFREGGLEEAKAKAELAMDLFLELSDRDSAVECDILIGRIEAALLSSKRAEASAYLRSAEEALALDLFDSAFSKASFAKETYLEIGDSAGAEKADLFTLQIRSREKQYIASSLLSKAEGSFDAGDFGSALAYAEDAKDAYSELGDVGGEESASDLMGLADVYGDAQTNYDLSVEKFREKDFSAARDYLALARETYVLMNDSEEVESCDFLLSKIDSAENDELLGYLLFAAPVVLIVLGIAYLHAKRSRA